MWGFLMVYLKWGDDKRDGAKRLICGEILRCGRDCVGFLGSSVMIYNWFDNQSNYYYIV